MIEHAGTQDGMEPSHDARHVFDRFAGVEAHLSATRVDGMAAQLHNAIYTTCLLIAVAVLLHRLLGDLLEEAAAPDTPSGR